MGKVFVICLFVIFCVKAQGQVIVNSDGTHSIQHGSHIINPNGTISVKHGPHIIHSDGSVSVQHGSVIVNPKGGHSTQIVNGLSEKDDNKDADSKSLELPKESLSNKERSKQQKKQQFYFKGRMNGAAATLDRVDAQRKAKKLEKQLSRKESANR